jgi:hypothetical protein
MSRQNVDVGDAGPHVDQCHDLPRIEVVIHLVRVLDREDVHVDDGGSLARLADDRRVVGHLVLLHRDQQDLHVVPPRLPLRQHHVVQPDVVDVERDVLFRLPLNRVGELLLGHGRELDLLDDHGMARQGRGEARPLGLRRVVQAVDRIHHERRVHDGAIDDGLRRQGLDAETLKGELTLALSKLDELDRGAANVETYYTLLGAGEEHFELPQSPTVKAT